MSDKPTPQAGPVTAPTTAEEQMKKLGFTQEQIAFINQLIISASIAAATTVQPAQSAQQTKKNSSAPQIIPVCGECQQLVTACKGEHTKMVVFPDKYPEFAKWFAGVMINGVRYVSNNSNQKVVIPACAESTIVNAIKAFEENERTIHIPRNKQHNSGSIGRSGSGPVNASAAWR